MVNLQPVIKVAIEALYSPGQPVEFRFEGLRRCRKMQIGAQDEGSLSHRRRGESQYKANARNRTSAHTLKLKII